MKQEDATHMHTPDLRHVCAMFLGSLPPRCVCIPMRKLGDWHRVPIDCWTQADEDRQAVYIRLEAFAGRFPQ